MILNVLSELYVASIKWATKNKMMTTFIVFGIIFSVGLAFKVGIVAALIAIGVIGMVVVAVIAMIKM